MATSGAVAARGTEVGDRGCGSEGKQAGAMGWDRQGQRRYYSRSRKVGGRVIREYVGGGAVGEAAQLQDQERRLERQRQRDREQQQRQQILAADRALDAFADRVDTLTAAALYAAGLHRHRRQWRRRLAPQADSLTPDKGARHGEGG